jgi:hypothetical protein
LTRLQISKDPVTPIFEARVFASYPSPWVSHTDALDFLCHGTTLFYREVARRLDAVSARPDHDSDDDGEWCYARFSEPADSGPRMRFRWPLLAVLDGTEARWQAVVEYWRPDLEELRKTFPSVEAIAPVETAQPVKKKKAPTAMPRASAPRSEIKRWMQDEFLPNSKPDPPHDEVLEAARKKFGHKKVTRNLVVDGPDGVLRELRPDLFGKPGRRPSRKSLKK